MSATARLRALGSDESMTYQGAPGWWVAALADPALAGPVAQREQRHYSSDHHGSESRWLHTHVAALRAAGFTEIGTLWQRGSNRLLCAVAS